MENAAAIASAATASFGLFCWTVLTPLVAAVDDDLNFLAGGLIALLMGVSFLIGMLLARRLRTGADRAQIVGVAVIGGVVGTVPLLISRTYRPMPILVLGAVITVAFAIRSELPRDDA